MFTPFALPLAAFVNATLARVICTSGRVCILLPLSEELVYLVSNLLLSSMGRVFWDGAVSLEKG